MKHSVKTHKLRKISRINDQFFKFNMYSVSFPCGSLHDIHSKKVVSLYGASPYCLFPSCTCIVTWAWSLAKGQDMVSWLLTGTPEQRYWQNRETANIGLVSSVGRAPARQSWGCRFKSRSSKFFFVYSKFNHIFCYFFDSIFKLLYMSISL